MQMAVSHHLQDIWCDRPTKKDLMQLVELSLSDLAGVPMQLNFLKNLAFL